jgi:hypothetical protein
MHDALGLGISQYIPGGAMVAFDDAARGQVTHAYQRTSAFAAISSVMILKALVEMPPSKERAIDARLARKRAFYIHHWFLMLFSHCTTS